MPATILIALGGNRRHGRHGAPVAVLRAAMAALDAAGLPVSARSTIRTTRPLGPSKRAFANAMVAVDSDLDLGSVLAILQSIEHAFGRRRGRRWAARVIDLDIIAARAVTTPNRQPRRGLVVPHPSIAIRRFVLDPLDEIAPEWRHPLLHLTARQLRARQRRPKPLVAGSP